MDSIRDRGLEHAIQLGSQMLDAAEAGDWASVATLQAECGALLRGAPKAGDAVRTALLELRRQHQCATAMAGHARDVIAQELERHRHNHRAVSAYLVSRNA